MKYVLIEMDFCWADEFDVPVLWFTTEDKFTLWKERMSSLDISDDVEIYYGTNEYINFESYEELINSLIIREVSEETYKEMTSFWESYGLIDLRTLAEWYE